MATTWKPTPDEVKALIPQRTNGGPFTEDTVPTESDVAAIAAQIDAEIVGEVGEIPVDASDRVIDFARRVATVGAAAQVELALFPEQVSLGDTSVGAILFARYQQLLQRLGTLVADGITDRSPLYSFPDAPDCWPVGQL